MIYFKYVCNCEEKQKKKKTPPFSSPVGDALKRATLWMYTSARTLRLGTLHQTEKRTAPHKTYRSCNDLTKIASACEQPLKTLYCVARHSGRTYNARITLTCRSNEMVQHGRTKTFWCFWLHLQTQHSTRGGPRRSHLQWLGKMATMPQLDDNFKPYIYSRRSACLAEMTTRN